MKNKEEDVIEYIGQCIKLTHSFRIICSDMHTKEMKTQDCQDNNKERVSIKQEMDKQPNRGKRKRDDDEDDQKPIA